MALLALLVGAALAEEIGWSQVRAEFLEERARGAAEDADGFLWFGTQNGLVRYDGTSLVRFTSTDGLAGNQVRQIEEDGDGHL